MRRAHWLRSAAAWRTHYGGRNVSKLRGGGDIVAAGMGGKW